MPASDSPTISVVMPVHNGERYVRRAVASLLNQTFPAWELLAVDDGSRDDSAAILDGFAAADSRVRVLRHAGNRGVSAARNTALRAARGAWVAYLDNDDEFYPGHLGAVARSTALADILVFRYDQFDERPRSPSFGQLWTWDPAAHWDRFPADNIFVPLGVSHRRELLDRVGGFDESLAVDEDTDLWRRFAAAGARFACLPDVSGLYHIRAASQSRTRRPPDAFGSAVTP